MRTETLPAPGSTKGRETIDYVVADDLPTLVWLANLAALELHTPQWRVGADTRSPTCWWSTWTRAPRPALQRVLPGGAAAARPAGRRRGRGYPKTSGKKGMQLCCPIGRAAAGRDVRVREADRDGRWSAIARQLIVSKMAKNAAPGEGLHRLEPEQRGEDDGGAVLAARRRGAGRVHAADLGRGRGGQAAGVRASCTCSGRVAESDLMAALGD